MVGADQAQHGVTLLQFCAFKTFLRHLFPLASIMHTWCNMLRAGKVWITICMTSKPVPDDVSAGGRVERWEPQVGRETGRFSPLLLPTLSAVECASRAFRRRWGSFRNLTLLLRITKWFTIPANRYQELWELKQTTPYSLKVRSRIHHHNKTFVYNDDVKAMRVNVFCADAWTCRHVLSCMLTFSIRSSFCDFTFNARFDTLTGNTRGSRGILM